MGYPAESVFYVAILANVLMFKIRLLLVHYLTQLPVKAFYQKVIMPVLAVLGISASISLLLDGTLPDSLLMSALVVVFSMSVAVIAIYYLGLDKPWRQKVLAVLASKLSRMRLN